MSAHPQLRQRPGPSHGKPIFRNSNMPLDKSIEYGKGSRRFYSGSALFDSSCRPGGGCPWCEKGRRFSLIKASLRVSIRDQEVKPSEMGIFSQNPCVPACGEDRFVSQNI